jgi:biopolymer transport protein ExbD
MKRVLCVLAVVAACGGKSTPPPARPATMTMATEQALIVAILLNGDVVAAGTAVKEDQLDDVFRSAFRDDKQTRVVIQAEQGVQHGRVIAVIERARAAGLTRIEIRTTSK